MLGIEPWGRCSKCGEPLSKKSIESFRTLSPMSRTSGAFAKDVEAAPPSSRRFALVNGDLTLPFN